MNWLQYKSFKYHGCHVNYKTYLTFFPAATEFSGSQTRANNGYLCRFTDWQRNYSQWDIAGWNAVPHGWLALFHGTEHHSELYLAGWSWMTADAWLSLTHLADRRTEKYGQNVPHGLESAWLHTLPAHLSATSYSLHTSIVSLAFYCGENFNNWFREKRLLKQRDCNFNYLIVVQN